MGVIYFAFMMFGVFTVRVPPATGSRDGWIARRGSAQARHHRATCTSTTRSTTPQFWLLWGVLCMNVTAGIGVLGQASPMIQEMFPGASSPAAAAGFVGLLSLVQHGRPVCLVVAVRLHRPDATPTRSSFVLGAVLYALVPPIGRARHRRAVRRGLSRSS